MDHSIGAVARLAGVSVKAVRHYSDLGLLPYTRTPAGHRRYDDAAVARLRLIRMAARPAQGPCQPPGGQGTHGRTH
ncbi:MerR family transcriptional regulator [Kribbella solani]|uniref:MerR family transcriptional regulator n=1 Tax=Kribbella solani TaxID=236067 RepID=UPI0038D3C639